MSGKQNSFRMDIDVVLTVVREGETLSP